MGGIAIANTLKNFILDIYFGPRAWIGWVLIVLFILSLIGTYWLANVYVKNPHIQEDDTLSAIFTIIILLGILYGCIFTIFVIISFIYFDREMKKMKK